MSTSSTKNAVIVGFIASLGCILASVVDSTSLNAAPNPPGGYQQSCRDIAADETSVVAQCMNFNGDWASKTTLNYTGCGGEIYNYDGQLKCAGLPPRRARISRLAMNSKQTRIKFFTRDAKRSTAVGLPQVW